MRPSKHLQLGCLLWCCCACGHNDSAPAAVDAGGARLAGSSRAAAGSGKSGGGKDAGSSNGSAQPALGPNASRFPGSGTGNAGAALSGGKICDAEVKTRYHHLVTPETKCMKAVGSDHLAATLEKVLECVDGKDTIHLRLTFDPGFVDNTYGKGSIGWPHKRGHTLVKDLTKSDHAEITVTSNTGATSLRFKLDYISELASAPSGFGSLGVRGGDGSMLEGNPDFVVQWNTSLSRNLNERGYKEYTVDSPATDKQYTPNPKAPEWDYRVVYEAWIDVAAFGGAQFGDASISFVHASPSKGADDTLKVEPGDCPPPFCQPDDPKCAGTGGVGGSSSQCGPDDPQCTGTGGVGGTGSQCGPDDPNCAGTAGVGGTGTQCGPDDPNCVGQAGVGGTGTQCGPDDPSCVGQGGVGGSTSDCPPDDPQCTGQGGVGGSTADCSPDDPECWRTGGVAGAPEKPSVPTCPPDQPGCSPE